ncbi:hypothetical protein REISMN_08640 (plasmid) [Rickettsia tamurae subsp. buchneri]|uniref:Uncharacterized protein n=1 Tax=Rickettsia tamurae subsp. buchneri TaxID=1462938 RepID=A0A8E0WK90_9RICK|nr:hypothetical protein REISMN_08640 [Rickettsia tamurae subsp. buchneri]
MDAWLKTSTKNKKQLMINEAVIYSASNVIVEILSYI